MASRGANTAAGGSGLKNEGKFRQRVDDHYKVMAKAKRDIGVAGKVHMASTLLHGTAAGFLATLSEEFSTNACGLCAVLTLMNGLCAKSAGSASNYPAGAKDVEKRLSSYAFWLRTLMWSLRIALAAGVYGIHVAGMEIDRPVLVVAAILCILSAGAYLLGNSATSRLQGAFEQQRSKAR